MENRKTAMPVLDVEVSRKIDDCLEEIYPDSMIAGNKMAYLDFTNSQIRGLETVVASVTRFSEIVNYVKNQAGKDKRGRWPDAAPLLLEQLESLESKAREIAGNGPEIVLDVKMRLARGWAKQVVAHCLYALTLREDR